jgi:hypothetical protein
MGLIGWMQMGDGAVAVSEEPPAPAWDTDAPLPWYAPPPSERFGVLLIAAGEDAAHYAQALQRHPCCRPDPGAGFTGARRLTLAHAPAAAGPTSAHERTDAYLADNDVPPALRRLLLEGRDGVVRALRARECDAAA